MKTAMKCFGKVALIFTLILCTTQVYGQPPGWEYNVADYSMNGQVNAKVFLNDIAVEEGWFGAFVGDQCRGYVSAREFPPAGHWTFGLICYSNTNMEELSFKYSPDGVEVLDCAETIPFEGDMILGSAPAPIPFNATRDNQCPEISVPIPDFDLDQGFGSYDLDISTLYTDPDGDPITLSSSVLCSGDPAISISQVGTTVTITEIGTGTCTITVCAEDADCQECHDILVTVNDLPEEPFFTSTPDLTVLQDAGYSYTAAAEDPDGDDLTYSVLLKPDWLSFDPATQVLDGTPTNDDVGDHNVILQVSDATFDVTQEFTITVENVNDAPEFVSTPILTVLQGTEYNYTAIGDDIDGDDITLSVVTKPDWLNFNSSTGLLNGTPDNDDVGPHSVVLRVTDGELDTDQAFTVTVNDANDAPYFTSTPDTDVDQGVEYTYTAMAEDPDENELTYSVQLKPDWLNFDPTTQILSGTPDNDDVGDHDVTLRVTDGIEDVDQSFIVTVNNVNDAPEFTSVPVLEVLQDVEYTYTAAAEDMDGDGVTLFVVTKPDWLSFDLSTGILNGTPGNDDVGPHSVLLRASDGNLDTDQAFTVTVNNANDAPYFTSTPDTDVDQGVEYSYTAVAEDPDGDGLTYSVQLKPDWLSFDPATQIISGTPDNDNVGDHDVTLRVTDGIEDVDQSFTITVNNVNDCPEVVGSTDKIDLYQYFDTETIDISGLFMDPDDDGMTYTVTSSNLSVVTVGISGTTITVTESGLGVSTLHICASDSECETCTDILLEVNPPAELPAHWAYNPADYALSAQVTARVMIDCDTMDNGYLGAFVGDQCRGYILPALFPPTGKYVWTLIMYSNTSSGEMIHFRYFSDATGEVMPSVSEIEFIPDDIRGSALIPEIIYFGDCNHCPELVNPPMDQEIDEGFSQTALNIGNVFEDQDVGDVLNYTVESDNPSVVTVEISGMEILFTEVGYGTATISLCANDGDAACDVCTQFDFTVNDVPEAPELINPIDDIDLLEFFDTEDVEVGDVFLDPDGDELDLRVESSDETVVTVELNGTTLTLTEVGLGNATITFCASDGTFETCDEFDVQVDNVNEEPFVENPIDDQNLVEGDAPVTIDVSAVFADPDGDILTRLDPVSSDESVITVSLVGTTLTITIVDDGDATVTLCAEDTGFQVCDEFMVVVQKPECVDPYEPNNDMANAEILGEITDFDSDALCLIPADEDWFKFTFAGLDYYFKAEGYSAQTEGSYGLNMKITGQLLTLETYMAEDDIDTKLNLYSANGDQLAFDDDGGADYFSLLTYTMPVPCNDVFEANNNLGEAFDLGEVSSFSSDQPCLYPGDEDYFMFKYMDTDFYFNVMGYSTNIEGSYGFSLDITNNTITVETYSTGENTDTKVSIYDAGGKQLAFDDDGGTGTFSKATYTHIPPCNDPFEVNNDFGQASSLGEVTSFSSNETCLDPGDEDFFKFTYAGREFYFNVMGYNTSTEGSYGVSLDINNDIITIETYSIGENIDTKLYLYDEGQNQIDFNDDGGTGYFSLISYKVVLPCIDPFEPNNSSGAAYGLDVITDFYSDEPCLDPGDEDYFVFTFMDKDFYLRIMGYNTSTEGSYGLDISSIANTITIETFNTGEANDTKIYLYDDAMNQLGFDDDGGSGYFSLLSYTVSVPCVDPFEPNNNSGEAFDLGATTSFASGEPCLDPDDQEWFSFLYGEDTYYFMINGYRSTTEGPYGFEFSLNGSILSIETYSTGEALDTKITLFDPGMTQIGFNDDGGSGYFSKLVYTMPALPCVDPMEVNDDPASAYDLGAVTDYNNADLCITPGDQDYIAFSYAGSDYILLVNGYRSTTEGSYGLDLDITGGVITLETFRTGEIIDTRLYLYDSNMSELAFNDDGGEGYLSLLTYTLPPSVKGATVGMDEAEGSMTFMVYPNPSNGKFILEFTQELEKDATIEIMDATGKLMMQKLIPANKTIREEYDLSSQPAGVYFIRIMNSEGSKTGKLIIH